MATDVPGIIKNLMDVYDSSGRTIIIVGGGGGQFIEYGRRAAHILALDSNAEAIQLLRENLKKAGLEDRFTPILGDFYETGLKGDAVYLDRFLVLDADVGDVISSPQVDQGPGESDDFTHDGKSRPGGVQPQPPGDVFRLKTRRDILDYLHDCSLSYPKPGGRSRMDPLMIKMQLTTIVFY